MKKSRYNEEQIVRILREADKLPVAEVAKLHGVSEASIYAWRNLGGCLLDEGMQVMKNAARTIQIFLPDGDPTGIRSAEVTTSVLRVIDIPSSQLNKFFLKPESSQVGIYFLIGEKEDTDEKLAYIGQSQGVLQLH